MKRLITLAVVATLMIAGSASAQWGRHPVAQPNATFAFGTGSGLTAAAAGPTTTNNNDGCDIGVTPAATLLLPYFEVETSARGTTTFFTITNTSNIPQIAHVTIWTDWSFPVLDFNIYLTGYDVQPIDLYDIIVNGVIAPGSGAGGTGSTNANSPIGKSNGGSGTVTLSATTNPNWFFAAPATAPTAATAGCTSLIGSLHPQLAAIVRAALVTGSGYNSTAFPGCGSATAQIGSAASAHTTTTTAVGYVTVDVAAACNQYLPTDPAYFTSADGILYDNTLTGDYEIINKAAGQNYAGGNPLVHIRAIPQGGPANVGVPAATTTNLPYTFYSRYFNQTGAAGVLVPGLMNVDRRQPLPSVFAARYIQGGLLNLNTNYRIWREGVTGPTGGATPINATGAFANSTLTTCANASANSAMPIAELVRFDEHENFLTAAPGGCPNSPCPVSPTVSLPETSNPSVSNSSIFPQGTFTSGDNAGWMYMNLNSAVAALNRPAAVNTGLHPTMVRASQNWVVVSMSGGPAGTSAGQYSVDFDATWLGNGCTGAVGLTVANGGTGVIGPAPVVTP